MLEIIETFMKIDTESVELPAVYRYSKENGTFRLDVADLKDDIFYDTAREHNWDWIPERSACLNPDEETHWTALSASVLSFDLDDMLSPAAIKSEGVAFANFADFRIAADKMSAMVKSLKADAKAPEVEDDEVVDTSSFKLPFKLEEGLVINDILIGDEHKIIEKANGEVENFGYVELDVTSAGGRRDGVFITTDLFFEKLVFTPSESAWDFIKEDESNIDLIKRLAKHKDEIQKFVKMAAVLDY